MLAAKDENVPKRELVQFISSKIYQGAIPKLSKDLGQYRKVSWRNILDVGEACLKLDQKSRACTKDSKEIMQRGKVYKAYPLGNHQGSAAEDASPFVLGMLVTFFSFFLHEKCIAKILKSFGKKFFDQTDAIFGHFFVFLKAYLHFMLTLI